MHARALQFTFSGRESTEAPNAAHPPCFHVFFHAPTAITAPTNSSPVPSHNNTHITRWQRSTTATACSTFCSNTHQSTHVHTLQPHPHLHHQNSSGHSLHPLTVHTESTTNNHRMHPQHMNTDDPSTRNKKTVKILNFFTTCSKFELFQSSGQHMYPLLDTKFRPEM